MMLILKRLLIFTSPLLLLLMALVLIDPYNFIRSETDNGKNELKRVISSKINSRLYKLIEYTNNPTPVVILGDSRADQLGTNYFEELVHKNVANLSFGGGTLLEVFEVFDQISKNENLEEVYIGVNFNLYNAKTSMNLVTEATDIRSSVISYLGSKYCLKAALLYLKSVLLNVGPESEAPPFSEEEFWDYQLHSATDNFYRVYEYPAEYLVKLRRLAAYCQARGIKLTFFIPPTHVDLQQRVGDFHLEKEEEDFRRDLASLGTIIDFDYPNEMTSRRSNFEDPYHTRDSISKLVVREIVTGETKYGRHVPVSK